MVHVPATISSVKEEGLDRGKENKLREKGRESVWQECFEFVWRRGTGMRQEPALSDVNGLFPGQYASRVCVCSRHKQWSCPIMTCTSRLRSVTTGTRAAAKTRLLQSPLCGASTLFPRFFFSLTCSDTTNLAVKFIHSLRRLYH